MILVVYTYTDMAGRNGVSSRASTYPYPPSVDNLNEARNLIMKKWNYKEVVVTGYFPLASSE